MCKEVLDSIIHEGKNCQGTRTERRSGVTESMYLHEILQNHRVTAICIRQKKKRQHTEQEQLTLNNTGLNLQAGFFFPPRNTYYSTT